MDGATSNFVGVQNSFETAEAGGTGVLGGGPGQRGLRETTALLQSHRQDLSSAASWAIIEKAWGAPRDLRVNPLSRWCLDRASCSLPAQTRWGFPSTLR